MKNFLLAILLAFPIASFAQILLPQGFECSPETGNYAKQGVVFGSHAWGAEYSSHQQLKQFQEDIWGFEFHKTKDGLWQGSGKKDGLNTYVIIVPESLVTLTIRSIPGTNYLPQRNAWLLQQVRNQRSHDDPGYNFTDFMGRPCQ